MARGSGMATAPIYATISPAEIKALKWAISNASAAARRELRRKLKEAGEIVAREIRSRTPMGGGNTRRTSGQWAGRTYSQSHSPGLLKKSTTVKPGRMSVAITNTAKAKSRKYPGGYRYGKRIEFDTKAYGVGGHLENGTPVTPYAFFYTGFEAVKEKAKREFDSVLREARRAFLR